jgi:hypothetical protein
VVKIFAFLELEQKLAFFKGLIMRETGWGGMWSWKIADFREKVIIFMKRAETE